jgi:peptide deformylase
MRLIYYPDPRLRAPAEPVAAVDDTVRDLATGMIEIMHEHRGIGLAANQVGVLRRVIIVNPSGERGPDRDLVLVNPRIESGDGSEVMEEGCLSFPGVYGEIERKARVVARGLDLQGSEIRIEADELLAVVIQHEIDHLDGIVFTTRMTPADRAKNRRRLHELEKEYQASHA